MSTTIQIIQGDITRSSTDAIVNAANSAMLGGGGVDGAIHRAAGSKLVEYCRQVPEVGGIRCPVGEARITPGADLAARWVIHAVGPRYGIDPAPEALLESAYRNSLRLARENQCRSISFPAISCGIFGYPHDEAASIAVGVCRDDEWAGLEISFYLFSPEMVETWERALAPA